VTDDQRPAPHTHHLRVLRTARYYTLGGGENAPASVWIVLHGYGQLAGDFIRYFIDLSSESSLVVAPEALNRFYQVSIDKAPASERPVGATWMTREDRASEIADYVEYLDSLHDEVVTEALAAGAQVNVIGFSQGAATATRWITHGRAVVHRLILWGGLIPPDTDLSRGPAALRGIPLTLVLGERDHYVDATMFAAERARLDAAGIPYEAIQFAGGHAVSRTVFRQLRGDAADASAAFDR